MSWRFVLLLGMVGLVWLRVFRAARAAEPDSLLGRRISWPPTKSHLATGIDVTDPQRDYTNYNSKLALCWRPANLPSKQGAGFRSASGSAHSQPDRPAHP